MSGRRVGVGATVAVAALLALPLRAQRYQFHSYGESEGLRSQSILAIAQDSSGYLWVGTENGLFRFDGRRFRRYGSEEGLPHPLVNNLLATPDGTLWIGTMGGSVKLRDGRISRLRDPGLAKLAPVQGIAADKTGRIFWATQPGLAISKLSDPSGVPRAVNAPPGTQDTFVAKGVAVEPSGVAWYGCGRSICRWRDGAQTVFGPDQGVPQEPWQAFARDDRGDLWARSRRSLLRLRQDGSRFERQEVEGVGPAMRAYVTMYRLQDGALLVPSGRGLAIFRRGVWSLVARRQGLPMAEVSVIFQDRQGSVWLGTPGAGLARWLGYPHWETYTEAEGLPSDEVLDLRGDRQGRLWAATSAGLAKGSLEGAAWHWSLEPAARGKLIRRIALTPGGCIWIATDDSKLLLYDPDRQETRPVASLQVEVSEMLVDSHDRLWVANNKGLLRTRLGAAGTELERVELPAEKGRVLTVTGMIESPNGDLWFSTYNGLYRWTGTQWQNFKEKHGLRSATLRSVVRHGSGDDFWVVYRDPNGAAHIQPVPGGIRVLGHEDESTGLLSNQVYSIHFDSRHRVWFGSDKGISIRNGPSLTYLDMSNGLVWNDVTGFAEAPDGSVWVAGARGISHSGPGGRIEMQSEPPPAPVVTEVRLGTEDLDRSAQPVFRSQGRVLGVRLGELAHLGEPRATFRYRLVGSSQESWIDTDQSQLDFPSLEPGRYRLEVQALLRNRSRGSSPAVFEFRVLAPWYETDWFYGSMAVLTGLIIWGMWQWRLRRIDARRMALEAEVARRTAEVNQEKLHVEEQNRRIELLLEKAVEASRLKSEFLANMSHEIRTPMNAVLGMLHLALSDQLTDEIRDYLETASTAADSLLLLLSDILDYSRIEAGRLELAKVPFSPRQQVRAAVTILSPQAVNRGLRIDYDVAGEVPETVLGDDGRLRQVLLNLIGNAIKFSEHGVITVSARVERRDKRDTVLRFSVADTGIGIPKEKLGLIFEAFRQADGSVTRQYGGTGLGLAICSNLVAAMGGRISVESEPGHGSRFTFTVRMAIPEMPAPMKVEDSRAAAKPPARHCDPVRILVVEDNRVNRRVAVRLLEKRGHQVLEAADGAEALELLLREHADAVVMDVQMPGVDGLEATRRIRARENGSGHVPIVGFTANASVEDREACLQAGMDRYLSKPVEPQTLVETVEELVAERRRAAIAHQVPVEL